MITVLVAAFQGEKYLEEQLDSILNQTLTDLQILISDDGSTDGTWELARQYAAKYPGRIRCMRHLQEEQKVNPAAANFFWLLSQAEGDYILLSDQDDVWEKQKAEKLLDRMRQTEKRYGVDTPILVYSDARVVDQDLKEISPSFFKYQHINPRRTSLQEILVENPVTGGAMMFNAALLPYVSQTPERCVMHDWWIALAASCFGRIECVREPLYSYRQHGSNTLGAKKTGSVADVKDRLGRGELVRQQYEQMFAQASEFLMQFGVRLDKQQVKILQAYLSLPGQSIPGRMRTVRRYHFHKSSRLLTAAQCFTMPRRKG